MPLASAAYLLMRKKAPTATTKMAFCNSSFAIMPGFQSPVAA